MKHVQRLLWVFVLGFVVCLPVSAALKGKKVQTFFEGELSKTIKLYTISRDEYFSLRDIASLYGTRLIWKPVTGKVGLMMNNRRLDIYIKSTRIVLDDKKARLSIPTRFLSGEVYVPVDLVLSETFTDFSEAESSFNPETAILTVERKVNIVSPPLLHKTRFHSDHL